MISREMNAIEIEVLNLIANKGTFEKPITANPNRAKELVHRYGRGFRDLLIWTSDTSKVRLSGMIGLDQVLLKIDRFDVLAHSSTR